MSSKKTNGKGKASRSQWPHGDPSAIVNRWASQEGVRWLQERLGRIKSLLAASQGLCDEINDASPARRRANMTGESWNAGMAFTASANLDAALDELYLWELQSEDVMAALKEIGAEGKKRPAVLKAA